MAQKKPVAAKAAPSAPDPAAELRGKLFNRLAVAGGLVASLLAVLAFFDYLATPPDEPEATVYTRPVPVAPKKEVSQPVIQNSQLPEPPAPTAETKPAEVPPAPAPNVTAAPVAIEEPRASAVPSRLTPVKPLAGRSADSDPSENRSSGRSTAGRSHGVPTVPVVAASPPPMLPSNRVKLPETPSDVTFPPSVPLAEQRAATARVVQVQPAPVVVQPSLQRLFSGFVLQAGVFTSQQRAEELHAKLTLSGVPSTLETRVQVGPFKTRQEAEAAQEKLRELGIGSVLVPPKGKH